MVAAGGQFGNAWCALPSKSADVVHLRRWPHEHMYLKPQSHIIDIDIIRHIHLLPRILIIDIGGEEDIQIHFHTTEEAQTAFDGITKLLQAQVVGVTTKEEK